MPAIAPPLNPPDPSSSSPNNNINISKNYVILVLLNIPQSTAAMLELEQSA